MPQHDPSFVILVIAGLSSSRQRSVPPVRERRLVTATRDSLWRLLNLTSPDHAAPPEWLGLTRLVEAAAAYPCIAVKIWDVSKSEFLRDVRRASELELSSFFKRVFGEGLGTFGGQPIGLILADIYITPEINDTDIAVTLQSVAAAAGAPALVGVSSDFPFSSPAWMAACERRDSRYLFPLLPRWRSAANRDDGQPWLHPGYLIAARAAAALRCCKPGREPDCGLGRELADAAANLLPGWLPAQAGAFAATAGDVLWDAEFKFAGDAAHCGELRQAGVNAVSVQSLSQANMFTSLAPAVLRAKPDARDTLAHLLLTGHVRHRLQDYVRRNRPTDSGAALVRAIQDWFEALDAANHAAERLVRLRHVAIAPDKLLVGIEWHPDAGGAIEQIELSVPRILDDRIPAQ